MADLFANASTWLATKLKTNASQSVTYMRGSQQVGSALKATYGKTLFEQDTQMGIIRWEAKDFILAAADLLLGGNVIEPKVGDRITDAAGNEFEVLGDSGEPCFKYTDGHRTQVRIHTKQVGT